jgi:hypothetical protein
VVEEEEQTGGRKLRVDICDAMYLERRTISCIVELTNDATIKKLMTAKKAP